MSLLVELVEMQEDKEMKGELVIAESVSTFLKPLTAKINTKPEAILQHADKEVLAAQIAALLALAESGENRESHSDFARKGDEKFAPKLYQFMVDINEPHTEKVFGKEDGLQSMNADQFLLHLGDVSFKSKKAEWLQVLEKAEKGDEEALNRLKVVLNKMNEWYSKKLNMLHSHFDKKEFEKVGASLDAEPAMSKA